MHKTYAFFLEQQEVLEGVHDERIFFFGGGVNYNMWLELGSSFQKLQTISSSWNSLFFLDVAGTMESICCSFTVHQQ